MEVAAKYPRVLLKISGEALAGPSRQGYDPATLTYIASEIASVHELGVQVAVVVGGGNIVRGEAFSAGASIGRTVADHMGMLGTVMNALALQAAIEHQGVQTRVQSALTITTVAEPFIRRRAIRHFEKRRVVVLAGGTGNPYFSTDTAAVLRALELECSLLLKATKVDGVYDKDPHRHHDAIRYEKLHYSEAIAKRLAVMDQTAFTMCQEHSLPMVVLDLMAPGTMMRAILGEPVGTLLTGDSA